jgi:hypothetical protein
MIIIVFITIIIIFNIISTIIILEDLLVDL